MQLVYFLFLILSLGYQEPYEHNWYNDPDTFFNPLTGYEYVITTRFQRYHQGMDYAIKQGTPINTSKPGIVIYTSWEGGYGWFIRINHGNGYVSSYGHLSRILVIEREWVEPGDVIGLVGSTGRSTGAHLHFELSRDDINLNPIQYLKEK